MNKFSKILSISILIASSLYASNDESIVDFEKKRISQNPNVEVKSIKINTKKELPLNGWYGYILDVEANSKTISGLPAFLHSSIIFKINFGVSVI